MQPCRRYFRQPFSVLRLASSFNYLHSECNASSSDNPFWLFALTKTSIPPGGLNRKNRGYRQTWSESTAVRPLKSFELIPLMWRKLNIEIGTSRGDETHRH